MPYREDFEAAQARIETLEHELKELRALLPTGDDRTRNEVEWLRSHNEALRGKLNEVEAMVFDSSADPRLARRMSTAMAEKDREIARLGTELIELQGALRARDQEHQLAILRERALVVRRNTSEAPEAIRGLAPLALCGGVAAMIVAACLGAWVPAICGGIVALASLPASRAGLTPRLYLPKE
jgi:hypothetical protein